jgi:Family of unknown function (DUF6262)
MATDQPGPLAAAAARKHDVTLARAGAALRDLDRAGGVINFQAIARAAGVSRQWLYQQPDLRREIEQLRTANGNPGRAVPSSQRATEASLRQRIRSLLDENHRLRGESDELRAELALAYGHQRDGRRGA